MLWLKFNFRYEDGVSLVRKVASAADFIWSDTPLEILGTVTSIAFDDKDSIPLWDHDLTNEEVIPYFLSFFYFIIISCLFCILATK